MATRESLKEIAVFDTETDGVDTENCHIVTAFLGKMNLDGVITERHEWLIDFGGEIPEEASAVHGITTEKMRAEGRKDVAKAIFEIAQRLDIYDREGIPVAIYNAPFDLTLLDREMRRHEYGDFFRAPSVVLDPLVLDKAIDKFRKGSRKLVDTAAHYDVTVLENAHDAGADCEMTGQVTLKLLKHPKLAGFTFAQLHSKTRASKAEQSASFREYRIKQACLIQDADERAVALADAETISGEWPMKVLVNA